MSFNGLSDQQSEILAMLSEECAEVIQIIGKILRHGYDSHHPLTPGITNKELLFSELVDVDTIIYMLNETEDFTDFSVPDIEKRIQKKLKYCHHQGDIYE